MTKKDVKIIAQSLLDARPTYDSRHRSCWVHIVRSVSSGLQSANPRFDPAKFKEASGMDKYTEIPY